MTDAYGTFLRIGISGAVAVFVLAGPVSTSRAAPQTFNTALPVAAGEFVFRGQFLARSQHSSPGSRSRTVDVRGVVSVLAYGVDRRVTVFGSLPVLDKELTATLPTGERIKRDAIGLADARVFGRYTLLQNDWRGGSFRVAPFAGLEVPTGRDHEMDQFGRLPPALQLGSGSWDPFGGVIATYQTLDHQFDAQVSYKHNAPANDFEVGDEVGFDASYQYRVWPRRLVAGIPGFLYAGVEGNFLYRDKNRAEGIDDPDSGGASFFVSPGLQYVTKRWVLETVLQVPVVQNLNGATLEDDVVIRAGFRMNF